MRKSSLFITGLLFLVFYNPVLRVNSQDFGKKPFQKCWQRNDNTIIGINASDNVKNLFLSYTDGMLEADISDTGKPLWRSEIGGEIYSSIIFDENKIFAASKQENGKNVEVALKKSSEGLTISSLSLKTGVTNWRKNLLRTFGDKVYLLDLSDSILILTNEGKSYFLNKLTGETISEKTLDIKPSTVPFYSRNKIYFGTLDKKVIELSKQTAEIESSWEVDNTPTTIYSSDPGYVFVGDKTGNIAALNTVDGKIKWQIKTGAEITSIIKVNTGLLVSSYDNYVYLISEKNGKRLWRKRLSGRSIGKPLIKDNVAVFSTLNGNDAIFIDLKKGKTINQIIIPEENYFLTNPVSAGNLVIFPTFQGLIAFGSESDCLKN